MNLDVFISYAQADQLTAQAIRATLANAGIQCWMPSHDTPPGENSNAVALDAMDRCSVVLLIFSSAARTSSRTCTEIERARRAQLPVVKYRIEAIELTGPMTSLLEASNWIDAISPGAPHIQELVKAIKDLLRSRVATGKGRTAAAIPARAETAASLSHSIRSERLSIDSKFQVSIQRLLGWRAAAKHPRVYQRWRLPLLQAKFDRRPALSRVRPFFGHYDRVDMSAFSAPGCRPGATALIQVLHCRSKDIEVAAKLALEADDRAAKRGVYTLATDLKHGSAVDVTLEASKLSIPQNAQRLIWQGAPCSCQFLVTAPEQVGEYDDFVSVRLHVNTMPVGLLIFRFTVRHDEKTTSSPYGIQGDYARRHWRAFLSYASPDRPKVLRAAQLLKAAEIRFFQDLLSIEPGERWERRLFQEIQMCDLFLLFWSSSAAKSAWVIREAEYALAIQKGPDGPDIRPIVLEGPPVPTPPASLNEIHFNDSLQYIIAAEEAQPN